MINHNPTISLEPPSARRLANDIPIDKDAFESQKDLLWDFTEDGNRIWKEPDDDSTKLTTKLRRVWQERGDFSQLTIEKIESSPSQADGSDTSDEIDETPKSVEDSNLSKSITVDELWEMKTKMAQHLSVIGGELATGLDLLNILLAPLAPEAVDASSLPIPSGGLAPSVHSADHLPTQPESITLVDAAVSLMRKQQSTTNASAVLKQASLELGKEVSRSRDQWNVLLELRESGWNMRPKGVKAGVDVSLMGKGAERSAKEIGIMFSSPEAAEALRASSFASLEPTSLEPSGSQVPTINFPPRPRRRLVISLVSPEGESETFSPWSNYEFQSSTSPIFAQDLEMARAEVLEEEIFGEVTKEARLDTRYQITSSDSSVLVKHLGSRVQVQFEMVNKVPPNRKSTKGSPLALLVSSVMRLMMTSVYRSRRMHATGASILKPKKSPPKILEPILELIIFYTCALNLRSILVQTCKALAPTQLNIQLECEPILESVNQMIQLLGATGLGDGNEYSTVKLGGTWLLKLSERQSLFFTVACPAVILLWLPHDTMTVGPARLTGILQQEIGQCLLSIFSDWIEERGFSIRRTQAGMLCSRKDLDIFFATEFCMQKGVRARAEQLKRDTREPAIVLGEYTGEGSLQQWFEGLYPWSVVVSDLKPASDELAS